MFIGVLGKVIENDFNLIYFTLKMAKKSAGHVVLAM